MKTVETFLSVPGYEGLYEISNLGNVKSLRTGRIMKKPKNNVGYETVCLTKDKKQNTYLIHRLVALAFIPNPNGLPEINHKDEVKTNNCVENLEWCTREYNLNYGGYSDRMSKALLQKNPNRKRVSCYDIETGELIKTYDSITEAAHDINVSYNALDTCLRGLTKTCKKMAWRYEKTINLGTINPSKETMMFEEWSQVMDSLSRLCEEKAVITIDL